MRADLLRASPPPRGLSTQAPYLPPTTQRRPGGTASPSPALRTASFTPRSCWGCGSPLSFPGGNSPVIEVTMEFTPGKDTDWEFVICHRGWGCPSSTGTRAGAQGPPRPSASPKHPFLFPFFFPQEAFNTQNQQPDLQYRLRLCHICKGK